MRLQHGRSHALYRDLLQAAGKRVEIAAPNTIADGLRSPSPGELTFPIIRTNVEQIVLVSEEEIRAVVQGALAHLAEGGTKPGPKDMGPAMRVVQQRLLAGNVRADGKLVSEILKAELAK